MNYSTGVIFVLKSVFTPKRSSLIGQTLKVIIHPQNNKRREFIQFPICLTGDDHFGDELLS